MMAKSKVGTGKPDVKKGNKVKPTTKAAPPGDPHKGHGHKGKG